MIRRRLGLAIAALAALQAPPANAQSERAVQVWSGASAGSSLGRGAVEAGAGLAVGALFTGFSAGVADRQSDEDRRLQREYGLDASTARWHLLNGVRIGRVRKRGRAIWLGGAIGRYTRSECEIRDRSDPFVRLRPAECARLTSFEYGPAAGLELGVAKRLGLVLQARWTRRAGAAFALGASVRFGRRRDGFQRTR